MKILCFITLICLAGSSYGQTEEENVNHLHKQKFAWLINKQYDSLELFLDDKLRYIHSNGWVQSKREVIDELKVGKPVYLNVTVEESSVRIFDDSAVVTGKGTFMGKQADQTEFNIRLIYTEVYVKSKKQWRLVSRQATKI